MFPFLKRFDHQFLSWDKSLLLGNGCMGTSVHVGVLDDSREVAVKRVLIQAAQLLAEDTLSSSIQCPYIVRYLHFVKDDLFMYLILDLCEETFYTGLSSLPMSWLMSIVV